MTSIFPMTAYWVGPNKLPPLPVGEAFKGAFRLSRPLGPLLLLAAIPVVIDLATALLALFIGLPQLRLDYYTGSFDSLFVLLPAIIVGGGVASGLAGTQLGATAAVRASGVADGQPISSRQALAKTKGVTIRVLPVWLLVALLAWCSFACFGWALKLARRSLVSDETLARQILLTLLLVLVLAVLGLIGWMLIRVKLFLFMPVAGFEGVEGFPALRRSWQLTRGAFGSIFVFTVAVGTITTVIGGFTAKAWISVLTNLSNGVAGVPGAVYVALGGWLIAGAAVSLFTRPLLWMCATGIYRIQTGKVPISRPQVPPLGYSYPVTSWAPHPGTPFPPPSARQPGNW